MHVYGEKINNRPEDNTFSSRIDKLLNSEGVVWHKGVTRQEVLDQLPNYDLAWAWRSAELEENTHEISTKFLEYSSRGVPVICFDGPVYRILLGPNYPIKAKTDEELVAVITEFINDEARLADCSAMVYRAVNSFFFSQVNNNSLAPAFLDISDRKKGKTVAFVGHDLKFTTEFIREFRRDGYEVLIDKWDSHTKHDESHSLRTIAKADSIFCEWALGNSVWYSKNKRVNQHLAIRFHRQEIETKHPSNILLENVDDFFFIAPHVMRDARDKFWAGNEVGSIFENYVDTVALNKPKCDEAQYTLGIVGIVPQMKRFDKALDVLEELRKQDDRYTLRVKGKLAKDFPWMQNRPKELAYYDALDKRIQRSPLLRNAVVFDGHGNDMADWFSKVGYLLSVSDYEGCHLSVAEGMASGTIPLIWNWRGAEGIYPNAYIHTSLNSVVLYIMGRNYNYKLLGECISFSKKWSIEVNYSTFKKYTFKVKAC